MRVREDHVVKAVEIARGFGVQAHLPRPPSAAARRVAIEGVHEDVRHAAIRNVRHCNASALGRKAHKKSAI